MPVLDSYLFFNGNCAQAMRTPAGDPAKPMQGFALSLGYPTVDEGKRIFNALVAGGTTTMPFGKTFWAEGFGMCTDQFGTHWMVSGGEPK
jgi:PhnB protein